MKRTDTQNTNVATRTVFGTYRKEYRRSELARFVRGLAECRRMEDHRTEDRRTEDHRSESIRTTIKRARRRRVPHTSLVTKFTAGPGARRRSNATTPNGARVRLNVSDRTRALLSSERGRTIKKGYSNGVFADAITRSEHARRVSVNSPHAPILSGKARETINYYQSTNQKHETLH